MISIYNLEDCPLSYKNGSYGGMAGSKDGIMIGNEEWLVKYPQNIRDLPKTGDASYSTSPLSEFIGSHIFQQLGLPAHDTILGIRNDKLVVACKDFCEDGILLEMRTIKNHMGKELSELLDYSPMSSSDTHTVDINELFLHLAKNPVLCEIQNVEERFFKQAIIDILIANNDRNNGNWGILRFREKPDQLAPVFDNGASFLPKAADDKIIKLLNNPNFEQNTLNVLTAYGENDHCFSAKKLIEKIKNNKIFIKSINELIPIMKKELPNIHNFIEEIPESIKYHEKNFSICSNIRKEIYHKQLDIRFEKILQPIYEQYKEKEYNNIKEDFNR